MKPTISLLAACCISVVTALTGGALEPVRRIVGGAEYEEFEDADIGASMLFVKNSGICETTPNVSQYSGYLNLGTNQHMWFWFFEARNNPATAPIAAWFDGGPGCSSMSSVFYETGPCVISLNDTEPHLNPFSWNEYAHMLYVDQPIDVGFSYGSNTVNSTATAAPNVWKLLQLFFKRFPQYQSRDFGLATQSYGGHYGPEFAYYIEQQNRKGVGEGINLKALLVNDALFSLPIQSTSVIDYALHNKYKKLITNEFAKELYRENSEKCLPAAEKCTSDRSTHQVDACLHAYVACTRIEVRIAKNALQSFDFADVREPADDPYPPQNYIKYLQMRSIREKIGARKNFQECSNSAMAKFFKTGDYSRPFLEQLSDVVQSGVEVLIWAGDADFTVTNYMSVFDAVQNITFNQQAAFRTKTLAPYTVKGKQHGLYKRVGNLAYMQVFEAGHELPYYQRATALQAFHQTLSGDGLYGT